MMHACMQLVADDLTNVSLHLFTPRAGGMCNPLQCSITYSKCHFTPPPSAFCQLMIIMGCCNRMCEVMIDTQDVLTPPHGVICDISIYMAGYMCQYTALTCMYVNVRTTWYSKRFLIINNTDMHHTDDYMVV